MSVLRANRAGMHLVVHNHLPARTTDTKRPFVLAWAQARKFDLLKYLDGLSKLTFTDDIDHWNAWYDSNKDEIGVEHKLMKKSLFDMTQTLLHEAGHRGQKFDPKTFAAYEAAKLDQLAFFLKMANPVHQQDYKKNGIDHTVMRDEIFAESYSRFALGMTMPNELYKFWAERARAA